MDTLAKARGTIGAAIFRWTISFRPKRRWIWRCRRCGGFAPPPAPGFAPMWARRAFVLTGTAILTAAGCYEMYRVLQVGGVTVLESFILVLFVLLFAWIAFSFMSALAGFVVLLARK